MRPRYNQITARLGKQSSLTRLCTTEGLKVNANKTEITVCTREGRVKTDTSGKRKDQLKQVETFKYLGSLNGESGGCEDEARDRVDLGGENGEKCQE